MARPFLGVEMWLRLGEILPPPSYVRTCSVGLATGMREGDWPEGMPFWAEPPLPYETLRTGTRALRSVAGALELSTGGR